MNSDHRTGTGFLAAGGVAAIWPPPAVSALSSLYCWASVARGLEVCPSWNPTVLYFWELRRLRLA